VSPDPKKTEKPIPGWLFILALAVGVGALGLLQFSRQVERRAVPVISEIQALNQTGLRDIAGELSDWIEIWNPTDEPIDLTGYYLSDDYRELQKWRFPKRTLAPNKFLIVFASGQNIAGESGELHTNFRLRPEGEYLALVAPNGKRLLQEFLPRYPKQFGDISFGLKPENFQQAKTRLTGNLQDMTFLLLPTPGGPNQIEMLGLVADTKFSLNRCFLYAPTNVALTVKTHGADIRYTLDGSLPNDTNGAIYSEPITIHKTTTVRATAFRPGFKPSNVDSHTFIFPQQIARSLDPDQPTETFQRLVDGLVAMPSICVTLPAVINGGKPGTPRDVRASLEIVDPAVSESAQVDCGVEISEPGPGGFAAASKHTFHVKFDTEFGDPEFKHPLFGQRKPRTFHDLFLWGGTGSNTNGTGLAALVSDAWVRSTMLSLGQTAPRGLFVNFYLNGSYRGLYSLMELPSTPFLSTEPETSAPLFDVRQGLRQLAGDSIIWNKLYERSGSTTYEPGTMPVDLESFIDFMLVQLFTGTADLDRDGNWMAVRPRSPGGRFEFVTMVNPNPMTDWTRDQINTDGENGPARLFQLLRRDRTFQEQFVWRAVKMLGPDGALSKEKSVERFQFTMSQIEDAVAMESLRWSAGGGDEVRKFLEERPGEFKRQLESAGLWK
jgi:hypothetical protein